MARRERWQQVPPGMRDLLADESARARAITGRILSCMRRWGYREVVTPTIEYFDTLVRGEGTQAGDRLFKLVDRGGELLALRPEMTTPVARLVTTHLRGRPLPLRLAYAGQVFRGSETGSGRLREFPQVGCELIGADTLEADAEIVALAVDALAASGAAECSVSLGHVGFLRGILEGLGLPEEGALEARALLYQKDFVGLRAVLDRYGAPAARGEALTALPGLRGPNAIREAQRLADTVESRRVLRDLETLIGILEAYGVGGGVRVDLSIIRDFDYYTGIVFEGHTAALGFPLLGGGRYDRLFEGFGAPHAATGFAVRVDRALAASAGGDAGGEAPDVAVAFADGARGEALRLARSLRQQDLSVTVEILGRSWDEVAQGALAAGAPRAVLVTGSRAVVREADGRERSTALADLVRGGPGNGGGPWPS
ncbi:MAG TPA: ATP phosphoribosyltransferase regulatory subunit [bacterium]